MDNHLIYWVFEYIKVFLSYGLILFVWPSVVFRKYLSGKSMTFRFGFCSTVQIVIINSVVLLLGLVHLLNKWTMLLVFWGILIWSLREYLVLSEKKRKRFRYLITGTFGWKHLALLWKAKLTKLIKDVWIRLWKWYKKHWLEYTLLLITLGYGVLYFSYGAFQDYSYGFGDMYVHHSWTYGLVEGQIFSAGVYPEAMHCVVYTMHVLFGVNIYSCILFLQGIHMAVILLSIYCLIKEVFHWRYSAIFALILFLTVDAVCVNQVFSMSRLQWTLPQEYGFHTIYLCTLFLVKYLKETQEKSLAIKKLKVYYDENLLVFVMALAASIAIHFYSTIMAFLVCVGFAVFYLGKIFTKKHFLSLVCAAICAVLIAVIPMGGALASGIEFQGSIGWAVGILNGVDPENDNKPIAGTATETPAINETSDATGTTVENVVAEGVGGSEVHSNNTEISNMQNEDVAQDNTSNNNGVTVDENVPKAEKPPLLKRVTGKFVGIFTSLKTKVLEKWDILYRKSYVTLYKQEYAKIFAIYTFIPFILGFVYKVIVLVLQKIFKVKRVKGGFFAGYLSIVTASLAFMIIYSAAHLGLPGLVAGARLCSNIHMLFMIMLIIPIDIIFSILNRIVVLYNDVLHYISLVVAVGLFAIVYLTGHYHGYLYYELTRYNAAVNVTNEIMDALPENTYTIVSPTDELYQVIQDGRHEEILTFLTTYRNYTIPTEYIFIFVEKNPIKYAHNHFFSGPGWLAQEKYQDMYSAYQPSVCPEVTSSTISEEAAKSSIMYFGKPSQSYSNIESRTILESKMYNWCESFAQMYPHELKVYYEDDDFVCYYIRQNTQHLYNLNIEY